MRPVMMTCVLGAMWKTAVAFAALDAGATGPKHVEATAISVDKGDEDWGPTTSITMLVKQPGKRVVGLDFDESKVLVFTDDRKTELNKERHPRTMWMSSAWRSEDASNLAFTLKASALPARDATKLLIKGYVTLKIATEEKTIQKNNVPLANGAKANLGPIEFSKEEGFDADKTQVSVRYTNNVLKSIHFLDKNEKMLPSARAGGGGSGNYHDTHFNQSFTFAKKLDQVTVRVVYVSKTQTLKVPFDLEIGLGL
jgi:hypothetical protein